MDARLGNEPGAWTRAISEKPGDHAANSVLIHAVWAPGLTLQTPRKGLQTAETPTAPHSPYPSASQAQAASALDDDITTPGGDWRLKRTWPPARRGALTESSRDRRPAERDGHGAGRSCPAAPGAGSGVRDMARGPGPLGRPRPDTAAMPKRGKRLKFRAHDACSGRGGRGAGAVKGRGWGGGGWACGVAGTLTGEGRLLSGLCLLQ